MDDDFVNKIMRDVVKSTFKVLDAHPELPIIKEEFRQDLIKRHPEWLTDLKEREIH